METRVYVQYCRVVKGAEPSSAAVACLFFGVHLRSEESGASCTPTARPTATPRREGGGAQVLLLHGSCCRSWCGAAVSFIGFSSVYVQLPLGGGRDRGGHAGGGALGGCSGQSDQASGSAPRYCRLGGLQAVRVHWCTWPCFAIVCSVSRCVPELMGQDAPLYAGGDAANYPEKQEWPVAEFLCHTVLYGSIIYARSVWLRWSACL